MIKGDLNCLNLKMDPILNYSFCILFFHETQKEILDSLTKVFSIQQKLDSDLFLQAPKKEAPQITAHKSNLLSAN